MNCGDKTVTSTTVGVKLVSACLNTSLVTNGGYAANIDFNKGVHSDFSDDVCFNLATD